MCATVCPSQALFFGTREQIEQMRPQSMPTNAFRFGNQTITTRVFTMIPRSTAQRQPYIDVAGAMEEEASARNPRNVRLNVIGEGAGAPMPMEGMRMGAMAAIDDPYSEVMI
jgi:hypothetical protein